MTSPTWIETDFRIVIGSSGIEYDHSKEAINRRKHGYSLESAAHYLQRLILPNPRPFFMTSDPTIENGEIRHSHMTLDDDGFVVFFVTTMRSGESVRVISLRRASDNEKELYFSQDKMCG